MLKRALRGVIRLEGRATVAGDLVAEARLTMVVRDSADDAPGDDPRSVT